MDRVVRWVDFDSGRSGGDQVHASRLRPTGMVVFATVDGPVRRRRPSSPAAPPASTTARPAEPGAWFVRAACWLLGR